MSEESEEESGGTVVPGEEWGRCSGVRGGGGSFVGVVVVGSVGVGGQHVKAEPLMLLFRLGKKIKRWWFLPFIGSRRGRRFKYSNIKLL